MFQSADREPYTPAALTSPTLDSAIPSHHMVVSAATTARPHGRLVLYSCRVLVLSMLGKHADAEPAVRGAAAGGARSAVLSVDHARVRHRPGVTTTRPRRRDFSRTSCAHHRFARCDPARPGRRRFERRLVNSSAERCAPRLRVPWPARRLPQASSRARLTSDRAVPDEMDAAFGHDRSENDYGTTVPHGASCASTTFLSPTTTSCIRSGWR